ncbi:alpha/beta fold hydrolase [Kutzneria sp. NPDC052558]|uniref:alpha/beta fold hydrolase n=1 Tax=Kutzneria sp. NPDC052558 TaxID=3364121 RepID=UPI0037C98ECB
MDKAILPHGSHGHGPVRVVALHGWLSDRHAFDSLLPLIDESRFTYVFPDVRGYGEAIDVPGEYSLDEVARDVLWLADELGWDSFSLVGHSMGGKASQRILADAPDRVRKLVGISPVPASGVPFDEATAAFFHDAIGNPAVRRTIIDVGTGRRYHDVWLDRMVEHSVRRSTPEAFAGYLDSWSGNDFHDEIVGLTTPVKTIVGANDPDVTADFMRATFLAWYPNCELATIADAGHYAVDETPVLLAASLDAFLS